MRDSVRHRRRWLLPKACKSYNHPSLNGVSEYHISMNARLLSKRVMLGLAVLGSILAIYELRQDLLYLLAYGGDFQALVGHRSDSSPGLNGLIQVWQEHAVSAHSHDVGESKGRLLALHGEPRVRERRISVMGWPKECQVADENWLYDVAGRHLVLCLKNGVCSYSSYYTYDLDLRYQSWKIEQIKTFARGRSQAQVIEMFGQPVRYVQRTASEKLEVDNEPWRESRGDIFNEQWHYYAGDSLSICLEFHGNKCDVLSEMITFH